jgi:hypothetical protein
MAGPLLYNRINKIPDFVTINKFLYLLKGLSIGDPDGKPYKMA